MIIYSSLSFFLFRISETVTYSDENYVSDTDIFEKLNRVSPEDRIGGFNKANCFLEFFS